MNEPKRWIDEGPPRAVERLLEAAAAEQPSDASLRRVLAGVGLGIGTTGAAATGAAATAGSGAALATAKSVVVAGAWTKWVVLSVVATGAGATIVQQSQTGAERPTAAVTAKASARPTPVPSPAPKPEVPVAMPAAAEPVIAEAVIAEAVIAEPPVVASPRTQAPRVRTTPPPEVEAPIDAEKLAEEVRAVDRARSALAAGRAAETLSALDDYDRRFGGRRFAPEALYLRMQALLALGRNAEARNIAERLVRSFPQSPHTARARRVAETNP
jgi:hypothetical protein